MRKLILLFVLLISAPAFADFNHEPFFQFELGTQIEGTGGYKVGYTELMAGYRIEYGNFKNELYGEILTYMVWDSNIFTQYPFRAIYTFGTRFWYKHLYIEFEHYCNHAVRYTDLNYQKNYPDVAQWMNNKWGEDRTTLAVGFKWN